MSPAALAASSAAFDLSAQFTSDGMTTGITAINPVSGGTTPNYNNGSTIGPYQTMVLLTGQTGAAPAFYVSATSLKSHVSGGLGVDTISGEGDTLIKQLAFSLNLYPLPPASGSPMPEPPLQIIATKVQSSASFDTTVPKTPTVSATAGFGSLAISGSLVGGKTIKISGTPQTDLVIYQSPSVTITLNRQMIAGLISCTPKCTFTPVSVSGTAIDVVLTKADVWGRKVSGEIIVGSDQAGAESIVANTARADAR